MMKRSHLFFALCLLASPTIPSWANASESFPEVLANEANLGCLPTCTLCHLDSQGGYGTIRPISFGEALVTRGGLVADNDATLACALAAVACQTRAECTPLPADCVPADSDLDGETDVSELARGSDPNSATAGASLCGPTYGCQASIARSSTPAVPMLEFRWSLLLLGTALFGAWSRRRVLTVPRG